MTLLEIILAALLITQAIAWLIERRHRRAAATRWHVRWNGDGGVLTTQKPLTETEYKALKEEWQRLHGGGRAHKVGLIDKHGDPVCTCTVDSRCTWCDEKETRDA